MSNQYVHNGSQSLDKKSKTDKESLENQLIEDCIKGKRTAQRKLYDTYASKMYVVAMRYAKTTAEADDILQEAFLNIFKHINGFAKDCPLEFWIRKIVVNQALKSGRRKYDQAYKEEISDLNYQPEEEEFSLSNHSFEELVLLIRQLPDGFQQVFNLYAIEGYKHKEIAEMLGISIGTSKSQYARARVQLQEMLLKEDKIYEQLRK